MENNMVLMYVDARVMQQIAPIGGDAKQRKVIPLTNYG